MHERVISVTVNDRKGPGTARVLHYATWDDNHAPATAQHSLHYAVFDDQSRCPSASGEACASGSFKLSERETASGLQCLARLKSTGLGSAYQYMIRLRLMFFLAEATT